MEPWVEQELRRRVAQAEERAEEAEARLAAVQDDNEQLRRRSDPARQAELTRRMAIVQEQHEQHHRTLRERVSGLEAELEAMVEAMVDSSATLEQAEEAAGEAGRRLLLVEQREAALAEAEAAQRCAEQQRVQPLGDDAVPPWLRTAPHLPPWTI